MKKIIFGTITILALVAFSSNSYAGENNNSADKCGHGKCGAHKSMKCNRDKSMKCNGDKTMKCGGKCAGG
ncbi:MAG TPA: hypothetical protein EYP02_03240, partial [Sulfurovum sp.]|nr:hypothetical protein [Sulfurovum sp.]